MRRSRAGWIVLALLGLLAAGASLGLRPERARLGDGPAPGGSTAEQARSRGEALPRLGPDREPRVAAPEAAAGRATVGPGRRRHILEGDATGGGHRPGLGIPGKSEFPAGWSDDRIIAAIEAVANDPASRRRTEADGRTVATGTRDGVAIRVVVDRDGRSVVTGYPVDRPRNPGG